MANLNGLQRVIQLQKILLRHNGYNRLLLAGATRSLHKSCTYRIEGQSQTQIRPQCRYYADDRKTAEGEVGDSRIDEFRAREEQRERERDAAEAENQASSKQSERKADDEQATAKNDKVDAIRSKILDAALPHVHTHGWTRSALVAGAEEAGFPSVMHGMFPEAGFALVSHFNGMCNEQLVEQLRVQTDNGNKQIDNPLDFLVNAVRLRLDMITPYKSHWPQALALIAMPQNASTALAQVLTLVDDICYYSGDRSVDFGWYTRRIGLATIMKMTELYMMQDTSPQHAKTWDFLKSRMDEAVQLQMMLSQSEGMTSTFQRSFNSAFITARNILGLGYNRN